jgi:hypothetical protein
MASDPACESAYAMELIAVGPGVINGALKSTLLTRTNLTEATRAMIKRSTEDVKKLASWPSEPTGGVGPLIFATNILSFALTSKLVCSEGTIPKTLTIKDIKGLHHSLGGIPAYPESLGREAKDYGAERTEEARRYGRRVAGRVRG